MIKVYYKPNCNYCTKAKDYLRSRNIEFEEIDLSKKENREARAYYRSLGVKSIPVIVSEDWIYSEWDEDLLKKLIDDELKKNEDN